MQINIIWLSLPSPSLSSFSFFTELVFYLFYHAIHNKHLYTLILAHSFLYRYPWAFLLFIYTILILLLLHL